LNKSTKVVSVGVAIFAACLGFGLYEVKKSNAYFAERKAQDLQFSDAYASHNLGIPGALEHAEALANTGSDRSNTRLLSYYRVREMNAASTPSPDGSEAVLNVKDIDFTKSNRFMMERLSYLTDLDLASFLTVNQPIFSDEARLAYTKHCQEKGCTPAYLQRALTTGLSTEQKAELNDCFNKIKWKLDSKYQVMFNYDAKGACTPAGKS
jgi:hypothetical protein